MRINATPKFEVVVIKSSEESSNRTGVYWPVYAKLKELAEQHEKEAATLYAENVQRQGLMVSFPSAKGGLDAIHRMSQWAGEDGWQIVFDRPDADARRELHLIRSEPED